MSIAFANLIIHIPDRVIFQYGISQNTKTDPIGILIGSPIWVHSIERLLPTAIEEFLNIIRRVSLLQKIVDRITCIPET